MCFRVFPLKAQEVKEEEETATTSPTRRGEKKKQETFDEEDEETRHAFSSWVSDKRHHRFEFVFFLFVCPFLPSRYFIFVQTKR